MQYDAYISYNPVDRHWIEEWLIPRLTADGISICTDETFDIGVPRITNIENAVAASRHVVLVLTPDWVQDEWNSFDYLLTHYEDPIGLRQRTLPVLHRPCSLPRRLAVLTPADLTGDRTEAQYQKLLDALHGERHLRDLDDFGAPSAAPPPRVAPATLRQVALGFRYDPFAFPMAEEMPWDVLEETFVPTPNFSEQILDLDRSAVLLAPSGGGKTASRRLMEAHLEQCHTRALSGDLSGPAMAVLIVIYNDFAAIEEYLPQIRTSHHIAPLLTAVAEALYKALVAQHDSFMALTEEARDWWWSFLDLYLTGESLPIRLSEHWRLNTDYKARLATRPLIFRPGSSIRTILTTLLSRLHGLKIERIFILVDELDSYLEAQSSAALTAIVKPLLNTSLLSLPGLVWKFFLPDQLDQVVNSSSGRRTERLQVAPRTWNRQHPIEARSQALAQMLRQRLRWASEGKISNIDELGSLELTRNVKIEQELVEQALRYRDLGPPRALLVLGNQLFDVMQGEQISLEEWNAFQNHVQQEAES